MPESVSQEALEAKIRSEFRYEPVTGYLFRRVNGVDRLARPNCRGYLVVSVLGRSLRGHRICWFLHFGEWPGLVIDHINGDAGDNRLLNLRDCSAAENTRNKRKARSNKSGFKGVIRRGAKWVAQIKPGSTNNVWLGTFNSPELAHAAYVAAARAHYGAYANGG